MSYYYFRSHLTAIWVKHSFYLELNFSKFSEDMEACHPHINKDCLIHIFTFFDYNQLINASSVSQDWHEAAETSWLWRRLCLQHWGFCNVAVVGCENQRQAWKRYFLRRSHLEEKMSKGRAGADFTCNSLRGHTGRVVGLGYLEGTEARFADVGGGKATICTASTDGTVRAWDVQKGEQLWCSPVQSPLTAMVCDREQGVVMTVDYTGLVKTWQGRTGVELASYASGSPHCSLLQYTINNHSFLSVGTNQGFLSTLVRPALSLSSQLLVCDSLPVNLLLVSPDKKWVFAASKNNANSSPKVIYAESLTSASEGEPQCQCLPVTECQAAVFIPTQPARLATIHPLGHRSVDKALTVLDVNMKKTKYKTEIQVQQVASSTLRLKCRASDILLEAKDSSALVVAADQELWLFSLQGVCLASFKNHTEPISSISVDSFRVVTASRDLSLRVLTWKEDGDKGLTLENRYHLLGGSHTMSRGFTHVDCDYSSIVACAEGRDGKDVLRVYTFTS
ncbi:F-box/WD repeat-containing protein 12 [Gadus macrocephalus]|uniref:F-box/WD repeat-containing protein 12 n=1 Tax=Gadus macrocephalus TaxID=80720 RepID=UPI0028CB18EE|nr:F-box/WD repeat-containing protein 12 [Gadus macrocephalus]